MFISSEGVRKALVVVGPSVLLGAWLAQTFYFDQWNGDLYRLDAVETTWDVYRSNNYLFNAMRTDRSISAPSSQDDFVSKWQQRNMDVIDDRIRSVVAIDTYNATMQAVRSTPLNLRRLSAGTPDGDLAVKIEVLKAVFPTERARITENKDRAQHLFWLLYLVGSILVLASTVLKERSPDR